MRTGTLVAAAVVAASAAGCDAARDDAPPTTVERTAVPDVTGMSLDAAADDLEAIGLSYETIGGGFPAPGDERAWVVCDQRPRAGRPLDEARMRRVHLKIARRGGCASPTH